MALFRLYAQQPGGDDPDDTPRTVRHRRMQYWVVLI